jgi:hypothetical protein
MLRRIVVAYLAAMVSFVLTLLLWTPADAAWSSFRQLSNTSLESDPSCAAESPGVALCAAIGPGSEIMYSRWNKTSWSAWTSLKTVVTSTPSCTNAGSGKVICAVRDTALQMVAYLDNSGSISSAATVKISLGSAPSCAAQSSGGVLCAGRGTTGNLVAATYKTSATWSSADWTVLPPQPQTVYSPVNCTAGGDAAGAVICTWISVGSAVTADMYSKGKWQGALDLGPILTSVPACTSAPPDLAVACFAPGDSSGLYVNTYSDSGWSLSSWSGWESLGGLVHGYSCAYYVATGQPLGIECGATALTNSGFWTDVYNGSAWSGWAQQGTDTFIGNPACFELDHAVLPVGRAMCVVVQPNGRAASITGP